MLFTKTTGKLNSYYFIFQTQFGSTFGARICGKSSEYLSLCDDERLIFIQGPGTTRSEKRLVAANIVHEILTPEYLDACIQASQILPCDEYIAIDEETVLNAKRAHSSGGLYKDKYVFAGPSATGTKRGCMTWQQFKEIVVAGGGTFVPTLGKIQNIDPTNLVVVHGPDHKVAPKLRVAIDDGARELNLPADFFDEVLAQSIDITNCEEPKVELKKEQPRPKRKPRQTRKPAARKPQLPVIDENLPKPAKAKSASVPSSPKHTSEQAPPKYAGVPSPSKPASKQAPPKIETTNPIIESAKKSSPRFALIESLAEIARNPAKLFAPSLSPRSTLSAPWNKVVSVDVTTAPWRTLSNSSIGDPGRMFLGANGRYTVQECPNTLARRVVYFNHENEVTFLANVPRSDFHTVIKGNAGDEPAFYWEAANYAHEAGGTTLKSDTPEPFHAVLRRVHFLFDNRIALDVALYATFYGNMDAVIDFFDKGGRFFVDKKTKPTHKIIAPEGEMDVDIEEHEDCKTEDELYAEYGYEVYGESQAY
jgi:hypothetical protein